MSAYDVSFNATYESLCSRGYGREAAWRMAMSITDNVNSQVPFASIPRSPFDMSGMSSALPSYSRGHHWGQEVYPNSYTYRPSDCFPNSYYPCTYSTHGSYNIREARPSHGRGSLHREHDDYHSMPRSYTHEASTGRDAEYVDYPPMTRSNHSYTECSSSHYSGEYHTRTAVPSGKRSHEPEYVSPPKGYGRRTAPPFCTDSGSHETPSSRRRRHTTTSNGHSYFSRSPPRSAHADTQGIGRKPEVDLYTVLGVSRTASDEEIKKAHRKLSLQYHPDRAKGDKAAATDSMAEINRAYDVLKNEEKRTHYDHTGEVFDRL